jgi:hypothetical protein
MAGRTACFLDSGGLQLVDIVRGEAHRVEVDPVLRRDLRSGAGKRFVVPAAGAPRRQAIRLQAAVDGPLVYVTGPGGIMCVNARLRRKVLAVAWPDGAKPEDEKTKLAAPTPPAIPPGMSPVHVRRMMMMSSRATPRQRSIQYHLGGLCTKYGNVYGPCLPPVDRAGGGVLYATPTPSRVVAIYEDRPLTEEEEKDW